MATSIFGNYMYDDPASYQRALAEWERSGRQGDKPILSAGGTLRNKLGVSGFDQKLPNSQFWQDEARRGATAPFRENPYRADIADQSRGGQFRLYQQMLQSLNGPSLAAMQGQRALGQSGQQALGAAALGAPGRAAMMQAGQVGAGMAGDVGQARLAEAMRAQAGMGGMMGAMRGNDLRSAEAQQRAGSSMQGLDLANRIGYAGLGARQTAAEQAAALELLKAQQQANLDDKRRSVEGLKGALGPLAILTGNLFDAAAGGKP